MLVTITLLCLAAAPALGATKKGLEVKFDGDVSHIAITAYFAMTKPQAQIATDATETAAGRQTPAPPPSRADRPTEMCFIVMWCPRDGRSGCVLTDDTGNIVGTQTPIDRNLMTDWKNRGFTDWPIRINGVTKNYWPAQQYKVRPVCSRAVPAAEPPALPQPQIPALPQPQIPALPQPQIPALPQPQIPAYPQPQLPVLPQQPATRIPATTRQPGSLLQDSGIFSGFGGELPPSSISNNARDVSKTDVTNQQCVTRNGVHERGLVARFDGDVSRVGRTAYFDLPKSQFEAVAEGWVQTTRPDGPRELSSLVMWCPRDDYTVCVFTDDTGYIAGTQTAMDLDLFTDAILDWQAQGYTYWSTQVNGVTKQYWTAQQYFITPALLAVDPETRIARRRPDTLLQDSAILVSGNNGELFSITTNACDITSGRTEFTRQACLDKMGVHYSYRYANATDCGSDQILSWLPLIDNNQLIGVTMVMYSKHTTPEEGRHWFEILDNALLKTAIPNGPDCLYDLPAKSGLVTLHTYYIKRPYNIRC